MEQETTQYQRCACISTTSCWGATVLWRCFFILTLKYFIYKTDFFSLAKKTFKFSPFLYMAIHRPPVPADEETLTHRSSCPTRFVLGPLFWRSQWQTNIVEQCARHWQVVLCVPGQCWRPTRLWQSEPFAVSKGTTTSQSPMKPFDFKYQVIALRLLMLSWFELTWR